MFRPVQRQPSPGERRWVAPLIGLIVLALVGLVTVDLINGTIPTFSRGPAANVGPATTPTPSNIVIIPADPRSKVLGSVAYVKAGNVWIQSGSAARQLTTTGRDSMPSFSPDGASIYYIETHPDTGRYACGGPAVGYQENVPDLMRIASSGGTPEELATGKFTTSTSSWFYFLREPVASPDGRHLALVTDAPRPCVDDVVVQLFDLSTKRLASLNLPENPPLGQQDPAWSPDGHSLLYVRNGRTGALGTPVVYRYDLTTKANAALTGPGYLQPAWSPDGRYVAVTHLDSFGSDVVILDATSGHELLRVTTDDASSAPAWSPTGDAIAYLTTSSGITDLGVVNLAGVGPNWTLAAPVALTELAGLDPGSRPSWFIPPGQLPAPPSGSPASTP